MKGSSWYEVQNYVLGKTKFYKKKDNFNADYYLDFSNRDDPHVTIDIKESNNFKKRAGNKADGKMNFLVVFIDTISRA